MDGRRRGLRHVHLLYYGVGKLGRSGLAANIFREFFRMAINFFQRIPNLQRSVELAKMPQHQESRAQQRSRIGQIFSSNVWRGAVHGLKNSAMIAQIRARNKT